MNDPEQQITWAKIALNGLLALTGGIVHELATGRATFVRFLCGGVVGAFTGTVVYCLCRHYAISEYMTAALTGLGGYAGAPLLDLMSNLARKFIERTFK